MTSMDVVQIRHELRAWVESRGSSYAAFAEFSGVGAKMISRMMNGLVPGERILKRIRAALDGTPKTGADRDYVIGEWRHFCGVMGLSLRQCAEAVARDIGVDPETVERMVNDYHREICPGGLSLAEVRALRAIVNSDRPATGSVQALTRRGLVIPRNKTGSPQQEYEITERAWDLLFDIKEAGL